MLEKQLKMLGLEYVDLYHIHCMTYRAVGSHITNISKQGLSR